MLKIPIARAMRGAVRTGRGRVVGLIILLLFAHTAHAGGVGEGLAGQLAKAGASERIPVIVSLPEIPLPPAVAGEQGPGRHKAIAKAQKANARAAQAPLMADLRVKAALGEVSDVLPLWLTNSVAMKATPAAIARLAASHPDAVIVADLPLRLPEDPAVTPLGQFGSTTNADAWNLGGDATKGVEAADMWALGYRGQDVVVAVMDTGVDVRHPALAGSAFEGGANGWCDVVDPSTGSASSVCPGSAVPTEQGAGNSPGHGTGVGSLIFGGDLTGTPDVPLGVAPDARWIGVRIFDDNGDANMSHAIAGLEWLAGLSTPPDIINMSWEVVSADVGTACGANLADTAPLLTAIQALRNTFGVFLVASSGNDAAPHLPAAYKEVFAVGATNSLGYLWADSGKGESNCTGRAAAGAAFVDTSLTFRPYPNAVAPGEGVVVADFSNGGQQNAAGATGTSFSAPHAVGVAALLLSAYPDMPVLDLEKTLSFAAVATGAQTGIDNVHGFGLLKAKRALDSVADNDAGIPDADEHFQLPRPPEAWLTTSGNNVTVHWVAPPAPVGTTVTYTITRGAAPVASGVSGTSTVHAGGATSGVGAYQVVAHDAAATIPDSDPTVALLGNVNRKAGITADRVDGFDLVSLAAAVSAASTDTTFDLDGDGNVTSADLTILKAHMGHKVTP